MLKNKEVILYIILAIFIILSIIKTVLYLKAKKGKIRYKEYLGLLAFENLIEIILIAYLVFKMDKIDFRIIICVLCTLYGSIIERKTEKLLKKSDENI